MVYLPGHSSEHSTGVLQRNYIILMKINKFFLRFNECIVQNMKIFGQLGYTDHSLAHTTVVANRAADI